MKVSRSIGVLNRVRGLSLVELLVSVGVSSILLVVLSGLLSVSLNQWNRQTDRQHANSEVQWAMATLVEDIQSVVLKNGDAEWLQVRSVQVEGLGLTPQLMFLARPGDSETIALRNEESGGEGVCAISYRLEKRDPFGGSDPIHALYRSTKSPGQTSEYLGTDDLYLDYWSQEKTRTDDIVASRVVGFDLVFRVQLPDGTEDIFQQGFGLRCSGILDTSTSTTKSIPEKSRLSSMSVKLTTIDRTGQALLNEGRVPLDEIIAQRGRIYNTSVEFPAPSLP